MDKSRLATVWLGGCSGCHMSFLDLDEWLLDLAAHVDLVFSPLADVKAYPEHVDVALVEGAIANEDHLELIRQVRQRTRIVIALGDCAVTGNVTALRNSLGGAASVLQHVYGQRADQQEAIPFEQGIVPRLLDRVLPVYAVVPVEVYLPGCPPPAARIRIILKQVLAGETPWLEGREMLKFG